MVAAAAMGSAELLLFAWLANYLTSIAKMLDWSHIRYHTQKHTATGMQKWRCHRCEWVVPSKCMLR